MFTFDINEIRKLGRNDKCWCGSGLKFKRCHDGREFQKPISTGEVIEYEQNISKRDIAMIVYFLFLQIQEKKPNQLWNLQINVIKNLD